MLDNHSTDQAIFPVIVAFYTIITDEIKGKMKDSVFYLINGIRTTLLLRMPPSSLVPNHELFIEVHINCKD